MATTESPILIAMADVPAVYGFSERQIKRWVAAGRLTRVKPSGRTGPTYLFRAELDAFIQQSIVPPGEPA